MRVLAATLVLLLLGAALARADVYADLGRLEREAVDKAMVARGLATEPAPEGKVVGTIHVLNFDVFQPDDGRLLEWLNHFHRVTREHHVRRESVIQPGAVYDPGLLAETVRLLRNRNSYSSLDPPLSGIVAMVPVRSSAPGLVDLLIVTRDVWSIRLNSEPNFQYAYLVNLSASLSENNLFGWRKQAAVSFGMSQGDMYLGPRYLDPNVLGTRLRLSLAYLGFWSRQLGGFTAGRREGSALYIRLAYPFYALANRWAWSVSATHETRMFRTITSSNATGYRPTLARYLPASDGSANGGCVIPTGTADDPYPALSAPCSYRRRFVNLSTGITRSFPRPWLVQRLTLGNELNQIRLSLPPDFPLDPGVRQQFQAQYFGPSERTSAVYVQYQAFSPRYQTFRDLDTFDLGEDMRLGPWVTLKAGPAAKWLGSESEFLLLSTEAFLNLGLLGGFQTLALSWEGRADRGGIFDQLIKGQVWGATPVLGRSLRVVASALAGFMVDNRHRPQFYVGGLQGLRGYPVDYFAGYHYYLAHLEVRSMAFALASLRIGGLVFADAGHAAERVFADAGRNLPGLELYGDVGVGLRVLIPQLNAEVARCDWAFPLRAAGSVKAGWPGVPYCGFRQAF